MSVYVHVILMGTSCIYAPVILMGVFAHVHVCTCICNTNVCISTCNTNGLYVHVILMGV